MRYFFLFLLMIALIYSCNRDTVDVANANSTFMAPAYAPKSSESDDEQLGKPDLSPTAGFDRTKDAVPPDSPQPPIGDPQDAKRMKPVRTSPAPDRGQAKTGAVAPTQKLIVEKQVAEPGLSVKAIKEPAVFKVSKTACYGNCKEFSLALHEGGLLVLDGKRNVRYEGLNTQQMMGFKYGDLVKEFQSIIVTGLADIYPETEEISTNLPATILYYTLANGKEKTVRVYDLDAAPEPLAAFLNKAEEMVGSGIWNKARE